MVKNFCRLIKGVMTEDHWAFILIALGILIRLKCFFENCSFCPDEAYVAIEIVHRSFKEIFSFQRIFPSQPSHPLLFIVLVKLAGLLFGNYEFILRLVPIISGIVTLFLFDRLLKLILPFAYRLLALMFFIFFDQFTYIASELKPYATDVVVSLALYLFLEYSRRRSFDIKLAAQWGLFGMVVMWLSSSSIFILGGFGLTALMGFVCRRQWRQLRLSLETFLLWLVSFIPLYILSFKPMTLSKDLLGMWGNYNAFMPQPFLSIASMIWIKKSFLQIFHSMNLHLPYLAGAVFLMGCVSFFKKDRTRLAFFLAPLLLTFLAAVLGKYPFYGRMLFFLTPVLFILLVEGIDFCGKVLKFRAYVTEIVLAGLLLFYPMHQSIHYLVQPRCHDHGREMVRYLINNYHPNGTVYIPADSAYVFAYYASQTRFNEALPFSLFSVIGDQTLRAAKWGRFSRQLFGQAHNPYFYFRYQFVCFDEQGFFREVLCHDEMSRIQKIFSDTPVDFLDRGDVWIYLDQMQPQAKRFILDYFHRHARRIKRYEIDDTAMYLFHLPSPPRD